jgi:hypothetical protein
MKKKIIIIGGAAKRQHFIDDPNAELWICNGQWLSRHWIPRVDRAFNLHRLKLLKLYKYDCSVEEFWSLKNKDVPFYTLDKWADLAGWKQFPLKEMQRAMPRGDYHCGSFDWMVAFAIYSGVKEIKLHGIGLCLEAGEPISARACLEYWCGYAEGSGIKITTAPDCDFFHFYHLVKSKLTYGVDDTPIYEDRTKKGVPYDYGG